MKVITAPLLPIFHRQVIPERLDTHTTNTISHQCLNHVLTTAIHYTLLLRDAMPIDTNAIANMIVSRKNIPSNIKFILHPYALLLRLLQVLSVSILYSSPLLTVVCLIEVCVCARDFRHRGISLLCDGISFFDPMCDVFLCPCCFCTITYLVSNCFYCW